MMKIKNKDGRYIFSWRCFSDKELSAEELEKFCRMYDKTLKSPDDKCPLSCCKYDDMEHYMLEACIELRRFLDKTTPQDPISRKFAEIIIQELQELSLDTEGGYALWKERDIDNGIFVVAWGVSDENGGSDAIQGIVFIKD